MRDEEARFLETLERGMKLFDELAGQEAISGEEAFTLAATYGFPLELTVELAEERGQPVDVDGYRGAMAAHREISRGGGESDVQRAAEFARGSDPSTFVGFHKLDAITELHAYEDLGDGTFLAKLRESPFYPAGGGQVTDLGWIELDDDPSVQAELVEAYRFEDDQVLLLRGTGFAAGARVKARSRGAFASRRWRTTRPLTCSRRRSGTCSELTSSRPARQCAPTSSGSTSLTPQLGPPSVRRSSSASTARSSKTIPCTSSRRPSTRPASSAR